SKKSTVPIAVNTSGQMEVLTNLPKDGQSKTLKNFFLAMITFFFINVTWVFFRAPDFHSAWQLLCSMFSHVPKAEALLTTLAIIKISVIVFFLVLFHWLMRNTRVITVANKMPWGLVGIIWAFLLILLFWSQESSSAFIYFQF
ncbi:MAG: MBOAT family protein, partial [Chitinophagaceae bacterium]|nr:MBOAT family protein [Chitinophagaceae bacterium]